MRESFGAFIDLLPFGTYCGGSYFEIWHYLRPDFLINKVDYY